MVIYRAEMRREGRRGEEDWKGSGGRHGVGGEVKDPDPNGEYRPARPWTNSQINP